MNKMVRKVYLGWFRCQCCPEELNEHPFIMDDMSIYCDCGCKESMYLWNVKLKIPVERRDANKKII